MNMNKNTPIGIVGYGLYIPEERQSAEEIAAETNGIWTADAIRDKLGIEQKVIPGKEDGTQDMGVWAAQNALDRTGIDPLDIDLVLSIGEEWKEYPLTTTGIYIQEKIGAHKAWAIDVQQRCCSTISAIKMAKDMMLTDEELKTVLIAGGYRNGDFVDYTDKTMSMMFNLSAAGGALILQKGYERNQVLGSHVMSDGSMARDAGVVYGGTVNPITCDNAEKAYKSLTLMQADHMKERLNEVSMDNWMHCIDQSLKKSGMTRKDIDYLAVLHFKRSMHHVMLDLLGLEEEQSVYLSQYGHAGQIDQIISLHLGLEQGKIQSGDVISMIAAGIGYAWAANVIKWG